MATDYDAPRKTDEELAEDSLEQLKAQRANKAASAVDVDEVEFAENLELPGADLSDESLTVRVLPRQAGSRNSLRAGRVVSSLRTERQARFAPQRP